ncbi:MAG TPA: hypothetical protein VEI29_02915 [Burkholderiaceae bacterium]|nr:hypothetical protein [Burkholderiaceae bacterium]
MMDFAEFEHSTALHWVMPAGVAHDANDLYRARKNAAVVDLLRRAV